MRVNVREIVKAAARAAAHLVVAPLVASYTARARLFGRDRALEGSSQLLAGLPGISGQLIRRAFLSHVITCHHTVVVEYGVTLCRADARLDEHVYIGPRCHLGLVHVERDALIAAGVRIPSGSSTHRIDDPTRPIREQPRAERRVRIGAGAWIGEGAIVMADVGHDAVVGAGAVVTRPVPAWSVVGGVPARIIHMRDAPSTQAV